MATEYYYSYYYYYYYYYLRVETAVSGKQRFSQKAYLGQSCLWQTVHF